MLIDKHFDEVFCRLRVHVERRPFTVFFALMVLQNALQRLVARELDQVAHLDAVEVTESRTGREVALLCLLLVQASANLPENFAAFPDQLSVGNLDCARYPRDVPL